MKILGVFLLGIVTASALDVSVTRLDQNNIAVYVTNAPPVVYIEQSKDMRTWELHSAVHCYDCYWNTGKKVPAFIIVLPVSEGHYFFRAKESLLTP